mmetsp:Transcript_28057/g.64721  ORF Transcript_28057/g.64721 Transcript_28057/m.64721 type:complete len:263 (-) Transcript_28057:22-810(-)
MRRRWRWRWKRRGSWRAGRRWRRSRRTTGPRTLFASLRVAATLDALCFVSLGRSTSISMKLASKRTGVKSSRAKPLMFAARRPTNLYRSSTSARSCPQRKKTGSLEKSGSCADCPKKQRSFCWTHPRCFSQLWSSLPQRQGRVEGSRGWAGEIRCGCRPLAQRTRRTPSQSSRSPSSSYGAHSGGAPSTPRRCPPSLPSPLSPSRTPRRFAWKSTPSPARLCALRRKPQRANQGPKGWQWTESEASSGSSSRPQAPLGVLPG